MKRFTRIVALILALVMLCSFPASADTPSSFNVLQYNTDVVYQYANSGSWKFDLGFERGLSYIDAVFYYEGVLPSSVSIASGWNLTILPINSHYFRLYGSFYNGGFNNWLSTLTLSFTSSGSTSLEVISFDAWSSYIRRFDSLGSFSLSWQDPTGDINSIDMSMSSPNTTVSRYFGTTISNNEEGSFTPYPFSCYFRDSNWRKYDYLDFHFQVKCHSIDSISCTLGDLLLDYEITVFDTSSVGTTIRYIYSSDEAGSDASVTDFYWAEELVGHVCDIVVRLDLTDADRTSSYYPKIYLKGLQQNTDDNFVSLVNCIGYVSNSQADSVSTFFNLILSKMAAHDENVLNSFANLNSNLSSLISSVNSRLNSILTGINSLITTVQVHIDTLWVNLESKLSGFQTSMETYLEDLPKRIAEEIAKIFKPTEGKFEAAKDESHELAEEKLGAVYQSAVVIDQIAGAFTVQTPQTSIVVPLVSVEVLPGLLFEFGGWDVPIVPSGLEFLIDTLKYVIDIVCTLAFLNGMKRRLDGFFGGEFGVD